MKVSQGPLGNYTVSNVPKSWDLSCSVWDVETLSLSRNYLKGKTDYLDSIATMKTLILSSNLFSCNAPKLNRSPALGEGSFTEPVVQALKSIGKEMAENPIEYRTVVNPFRELKGQYDNAVHVFAGNTQLESGASSIPQNPASRVVKRDTILQGQVQTFQYHSGKYEKNESQKACRSTLAHPCSIPV